MPDTPRRIRMDRWTPAERAIYDAMQAVEALPADVRLTEAVVLLGRARARVADYVDGVQQSARTCDLCKLPMPDGTDGHGLGECAPICPTCGGSGSAERPEPAAGGAGRLRKAMAAVLTALDSDDCPGDKLYSARVAIRAALAAPGGGTA